MSWLRKQVSSLSGPEVILHLGGCRGVEKDLIEQLQPRRVYLVEPDPVVLTQLLDDARGLDGARVLPVAVTAQAGEVTLNRFNNPQVNSVRTPTAGLQKLFPGLRQIGWSTVQGLSAADLVNRLELGAEDDNWLIVDMPGVEADILLSLAHEGLLQRFSRIFLRVGRDGLYEGAGCPGEILMFLDGLGYRPQGRLDDADPDWPRYHLFLNKDALECQRLKQTIHQLEDQLRTLEAHAEEQDKDLAVALRLQALREADLQELQERYAVTLDAKERQEDLLRKLRQRLKHASEFLKQINMQGSDMVRRDVAVSLVRALTGEVEEP